MKKILFLIGISLTLFITACSEKTTKEKAENALEQIKENAEDVKKEIENKAEELKDETGDIDIDKLEQMMDDAKN